MAARDLRASPRGYVSGFKSAIEAARDLLVERRTRLEPMPPVDLEPEPVDIELARLRLVPVRVNEFETAAA